MRTFLAAPPVSAFAMVMGLSGLSLAWTKFSQVTQLSYAQDFALAFGALAALVFVVLVVGLLRKQIQQPEKLIEEWNHPVKSSFFGAISVEFVYFQQSFLITRQSLQNLFGFLEQHFI